MKRRRAWNSTHEKEFVRVFEGLAVRTGAWNVWSDFVTLTAIALSNACEPDEKIKVERRDTYEATSNRYTQEEVAQLEELAKITIAAYEDNPQQDFLGELYMGLDFGSSWHGQFFTPWNVAYMMAKMTISPDCAKQEEKGYIAICDPCCGAGCMLVAAAAAYQGKSSERTYQNDVLFVGQDLDRVVALMCYIQLSVLGCAGYVAIGNSFTNPVDGVDLFPTIGEGGELWFTPMWYSPTWTFRRFDQFMSVLDERSNEIAKPDANINEEEAN